MFEDRANLLERDAGEQGDEFPYRNTTLEVFEQGRYGHARAPKKPGAADASGIALDRITGGPIDHEDDASTIASRRLDRMASCELAAACLLGIVDYVASHAEPHVEHEGINRKQEAGHGSQV